MLTKNSRVKFNRFGRNENRKLITTINQYNVLEVAPLNKPVGENGYSPIEKVLLDVTEELPKLKGRHITPYVLGAKGSKAPNLIETVEAIGSWNGIENRSDKFIKECYKRHFERINLIPNIDIIHNHTFEFTEYFTTHDIEIPVVNTVHISYETEKLDHYEKDKCFYVAISDSHRRELEKKGIPISRVVYNGIDISEIPFKDKKQDYVLSLGRITQDKGQHIAIESAILANQKIVVSGPIQGKVQDQKYFEEKIKPYIELEIDFEKNPVENMKTILNTDKRVIYCPEMNKSKFLLYKNAKAFMFPIQWEEPFGLVMVEAMATGTPVIGYNRGSVPEIIEDGKSGYIIEDGNIDGLAKSIDLVNQINPINCRKRASQFSRIRMAEGYADFFEDILERYI